MEQTLHQRNSSRNEGGTGSLKALTNKIIEQNKKGNNPGTAPLKPVPPMPQSSIACGTNAEMDCKVETDNFLYDFEERLAIAEYDGEPSPVQAHRIAYLDAFLSILFDISELDPQRDWLNQKVQTALSNLEAQNLPTIIETPPL